MSIILGQLANKKREPIDSSVLLVAGVGFEPTAFGGGYEPNKKIESYQAALPRD